eukprot:CAMPEP_0170896458 /NCGR_PEP_ID=MMETSP0734-20130129/44797_1 /TAXON_ID=186038 /ORGANISM="Fragilariopsis kerguelensis, Strain L26-C5" /LENGTH=512 /DNA_ID=CAMNT_0011288685 /DNA_START=8 /DNA_END=1548 /DNA_ORIENTATION=-
MAANDNKNDGTDDVVNMRFPNLSKEGEKLFTDIISQQTEDEGNTNAVTLVLEEEGGSTPDRRRSSILKLRPSIMSQETSERVIESLMKLDEQQKQNKKQGQHDEEGEEHTENDYEASFEMKQEEEKKTSDDDEDDDDGALITAESPLMISRRKSRLPSLTSSFCLMSAYDIDLDADAATDAHVVDPSLPYKPIAGSTSIQLKNATDPAICAKTGKIMAGWRTVDPSTLHIRGCGYDANHHHKIESPGMLYDCINADVFESQHRVPDLASKVVLPTVTFKDDKGTKTWTAPDLFVISVALPTSPPSLYGANSNKDDGLGYTVVMYYQMRADTRAILRRITAPNYQRKDDESNESQSTNKTNAVRLFEKWCQRAPSHTDMFSRFKVLPQAENLPEMGLPSWIEKFNGMAFLVKRAGETGYVFTHPTQSCMEFDVSLHPFPYLAKKGICYMKDTYFEKTVARLLFEKTVVTFAFCIEGRSEEELPECVLGAFQLCYPNPVHAIQAEEWFAGPSHP